MAVLRHWLRLYKQISRSIVELGNKFQYYVKLLDPLKKQAQLNYVTKLINNRQLENRAF